MSGSLDYLDVYDEESSKASTTAAARRGHRLKKKSAKRLTTTKSRGGVMNSAFSAHGKQRRTSRSAPRRNVVKRTKAQLRATRKMIAANKRRMKAKRRGKRRNPVATEKNPIARAGTKRGAKKAARTRKANKAKRSRAAKKGHRARKRKGSSRKSGRKVKKGARVSSKRSRAAKKAARTRAEKKAIRSRAAKKAARTRKRKGGGGKRRKSGKKRKSGRKAKRSYTKGRRRSGKRSKASYRKAARKAARTRKRRRAGPYKSEKARRDDPAQMYAESRRRRKGKRRRNPISGIRSIKNPIPLEGGLDFFSGVFAVALGYIFASGADRFGSTHALTPASTAGQYTDNPAVGQIYDSESPQLPIWSSGTRIAFNVLAIAAPLGLSAFIKDRGPKSFFQLMAFAAIARTVGKAADDGLSMALASTSFGLRLYAPEMAAQSKLTSATTTALTPATPGTFAGIPRGLGAAANGRILAAGPGAPRAGSAPRQVAAAPKQQEYRPLGDIPQSATGFAPPPQQPQGSAIHSTPFSTGPSFNPWADTNRNSDD